MSKRCRAVLTEHDVCHFVDPVSGERYGPWGRQDPHGQDLIGDDEEGLWWGTERAAWVLSPGPIHGRFVRVTGQRKGVLYDGFFIGSEAEAVDYVERRGFDVFHIEEG
jgi:hypothetical protein